MRSSRIVFVLAYVAVFLLTATEPARAQANSLPAMIRQQYGLINLPLPIETDVSCGVTPVQLLKGDAARIEDVFYNLGTAACTLRHGANVTTTTGYLLSPAGGFLSENWTQDLTLQTYEMWCVCAGAGNNIHVLSLDLQ